MNTKCLQCQSESIIEGKIYNQADYINPPAYFKADKTPFYAVFSAIPLGNSFFACSSCGLTWSRIDSQQLQKYVVSKKAF